MVVCRTCERRGHLKAGIGGKSILQTRKRFNCHIYVDGLGQPCRPIFPTWCDSHVHGPCLVSKAVTILPDNLWLPKAQDEGLLLFCYYVDHLERGVNSRLVTELQM